MSKEKNGSQAVQKRRIEWRWVFVLLLRERSAVQPVIQHGGRHNAERMVLDPWQLTLHCVSIVS